MANVPPVSSPTWTPEDDLLLKNSIEAGASLEALAKGAVKFSRRFTLHELQDRWHSLLYDPNVSVQASSPMIELELSGAIHPSKYSRWYNSKGSEKVTEKRKGESIRGQYYALRKKLRTELYCSPDLGFLDKPDRPYRNEHGHDFQKLGPFNNEDRCVDSVIDDCLANDLGLQETDLEILREAFPETIGNISTRSDNDNADNRFRTGFHNIAEDNNPKRTVRKDVSPLIRNGAGSSLEMKMEPKDGTHTCNGDSNGPLQTPDGFGGKQHFNSPGSDGSASLHMMGYSSPLPRLPLWKTIEDVSAPDMPVDENSREVPQGAVETLTLQDASFLDPHAVSEVEFTDLPDSLLNFSNEDGLLFMDVDGKDTMDKSCYNNLNSLLLGSPKEVLNGNLCKVGHKTSPVGLCPAESEHITPSVHRVQQSDHKLAVDVQSTSVLISDPLMLTDGKINCALNTEDTEVPCNDDIFLLIHPGTSFVPSARRPITTYSSDLISSSADEKDGEQVLNLWNKGKNPASRFTGSQTLGPNLLPPSVAGRPLVGSAAKSELPKTKSAVLRPALLNKSIRDSHQSKSGGAAPITTVAGVLEEDLTKVEPTADTRAIYSERPLHEAEPVKLTTAESIANPSTSDQDECESDGNIPYYSDVEAMILDMDLEYDQDSCIRKRVARYQHEDTKRTLIRLEQTARSSIQRAMQGKGAFAILYGRHLKHYIQKTEVTLGRSTDYNDIDIDLRKEGRANKISRLQATIKMETDGSFSLKNHGKNPISINGKDIISGQKFALSSNSLIEIKGMSFMFEINDKYVRRYVHNLTKQSQGNNGNFEWSSEEEA